MCDRYCRISIEPSMMLYKEVNPAIRRVPYGLYSLIGPLDSVSVDTVVVRSKRIKLQRGISHAGEFLGPRSELFWSDALVVPAVGVDTNPVSVHAPDELVYWSPEVLASNVPAGDIESAERGGRLERDWEVEVVLVPLVNVQLHIERVSSLVDPGYFVEGLYYGLDPECWNGLSIADGAVGGC